MGTMNVSSDSQEEQFFILQRMYTQMFRDGLYNANVVSENMSFSFSDIVKNLVWKVTIIFPYSTANSSFSL